MPETCPECARLRRGIDRLTSLLGSIANYNHCIATSPICGPVFTREVYEEGGGPVGMRDKTRTLVERLLNEEEGETDVG